LDLAPSHLASNNQAAEVTRLGSAALVVRHRTDHLASCPGGEQSAGERFGTEAGRDDLGSVALVSLNTFIASAR
jgi:hypothetical protein